MAGILIIEDDEIVGDIVSDTLSAHGHSVQVVINGEDAADAINRGHPDLIVLDCALPGRSGLLILKDLRGSDGAANTPVLILSARRSDWHVNLTMREGANDYVTKPFELSDLVHRVEKLLKRHKRAFGF